jgi:hypothetical protein
MNVAQSGRQIACCWSAVPSDIRSLLWMSAQIPAWQPSFVREQRIHTSLYLRRIENEFCLSILLQHGVIVIHRDCTIRVPIRRRPNPKNDVIQTIRQSRRSDYGKNHGDKDSSQPHSQVWSRCRCHAARLYGIAPARFSSLGSGPVSLYSPTRPSSRTAAYFRRVRDIP